MRGSRAVLARFTARRGWLPYTLRQLTGRSRSPPRPLNQFERSSLSAVRRCQSVSQSVSADFAVCLSVCRCVVVVGVVVVVVVVVHHAVAVDGPARPGPALHGTARHGTDGRKAKGQIDGWQQTNDG